MGQLIPAFDALVAPFRTCFHPAVFATFRALIAGWLLCTGKRTISEVWQAAGQSGRRHHDAAYSAFASASWDWDDPGLILARQALESLAPDGPVWLAVDDTLCHKRGPRVAFGGFYLDPVLSTRGHRVTRFGLSWVVLGLTVDLPDRPDRPSCLPVLWRLYRKAGQPGHRTRTALAAEMAATLAGAFPGRRFYLAGDNAYLCAATLRDRPANLHVVGPLRLTAALHGLPPGPAPGRRGRPRVRGDRLPSPAAMLADARRYPRRTLRLPAPREEKAVRVHVLRRVLWYHACGAEPVTVILIRDPSGRWRDAALLSTDPTAPPARVIAGYLRRWSLEVVYFESKQLLGLHDPRVRCPGAVERAHPMAWFVASLAVLWYAEAGRSEEAVERQRPWYRHKVTPTFSDMLGSLRLALWRRRIFGDDGCGTPTPEVVRTLLHRLAAVA